MINLLEKMKELITSIRSEKLIRLERIISINSNIINAIDVHGNKVVIIIDECRKNWYNEFMGPDYIISPDDKMIGERNSIAVPPYIIFYSSPVYYIELNTENFPDLRDKLESRGFQTFDTT